MAQFTWTYDAPLGVYKSHYLSRQIYRAAVAETAFMDFVTPIGGFGKRKGESVTVPRIGNLTEPTSVVLNEVLAIPEDQFSMSSQAVTVQELGRAVPFTSFAQDLSAVDLENEVQRTLKDQMALALDTLAAAAAKSGKIKYAPTGLASSTVTTNGTFGATATANMNVWHAEEIADYLYDTLHAAPAGGGDYVGVFRTRAIRGIMRDPAWEIWHQYTNPQAKYNGEVGRLERIRFVRTNHSAALGNVGTGSVLGEGVVMGGDALIMAETQAPELRAAIPKDFGRFRAIAWYAQLAFGAKWSDSANAGQANTVHVGSL